MSIRTALFIAAACVVAACGGDSPGTGPVATEDAEAGCRRGCVHDEECNPGGQTVEQCTTECVAGVTGWFRADVFEAVVDCATGLACGADDDVCFESCDPTSTHEAYEAQCREVFAACGTADQINGFCETTPMPDSDVGVFCVITPSIIEEMTACIPDGTACQAGSDCVTGVLRSHGIFE